MSTASLLQFDRRLANAKVLVSSHAPDEIDPRLILVEKKLEELVAMSNSTDVNYTGHPEAQKALNLTASLREVVVSLLDEAEAMTQVAQKMAEAEQDAFEDCHNFALHVQNFEREVQEHVQCRGEVPALERVAVACNSQKEALASARDVTCGAYADFKAIDQDCPAQGGGEANEDWILRAKTHFTSLYGVYLSKKSQCEAAVAAHDAVDCGQANAAFDNKEGACNTTYIRLESHSCEAAKTAADLLNSYDVCYASKKEAYEDTVFEDGLEAKRVLNSKMAVRLVCLIDSIVEESEGSAFKVDEAALAACADRPEYNSTHLEVAWPDTPPKTPPVVPSSYPCNSLFQSRISEHLPLDARVPQCTECEGIANGVEEPAQDQPAICPFTVPQGFGRIAGDWSGVCNRGNPPDFCYFTHVAKADDGMYIAGVRDESVSNFVFKMVKFDSNGISQVGTGEYDKGMPPATAEEMVARYAAGTDAGSHYIFVKGDAFGCGQDDGN